MYPPSVSLEQDGFTLEPFQASFEMALSIDWLGDNNFRQPADEPLIVGRISKRPIQSGRRDLEHVRVIDDILHIENGTHVTTDPFAVFHSHAGFRRSQSRVGTRAIEINP